MKIFKQFNYGYFPPLLQIQVNVEDINDEAPYFPFSEYTATVTEDAPRGQPVASVKATDADANSQVGHVSFSFHCFHNLPIQKDIIHLDKINQVILH